MILRERLKSLLKNLKYIKQERGAVFVLTAILLPVLFGCLGIGYDVGNIYMHKARLQNVADAAALAGGRAYLQSQTKTNGKDSVDGTMDYRSKDIANCTYKGGRSMTVKYEYGTQTTINRGSTTKHKDADDAADAYINANIVNLGSTVYADKYSHFALNYGSADSQIFYRIGLYETVPLRFLPVITNKTSETVRAGAIAVMVPGKTVTTTTIIPGTGSSSSTITHASIFDNLFTFSEYLTIQNGVAGDGTIKKVFEGDMVYTHYNGSAESGSANANKFFENSTPGPGNDVYDNPNNYTFASSGSSANGIINEPIIDTFQDTTAYVGAFLHKLNSPHVDITSSDFTLTGDADVYNSCEYYIEGQNVKLRKKWDNYDQYYLLDENGNPRTITYEGKTYDVCYLRIGNSPYVLCAKQQEPTMTIIGSGYDITVTTTAMTYLLNQNNAITNCYIRESTTVKKHQWWSENPQTEKKTCIKIGGSEYDLTYNSSENRFEYSNSPLDGSVLTPAGVSLSVPVDPSSFKTKQYSGTSNIFHISKATQSSTGKTGAFNLNIPNSVGNNDTPIYIIIDEDMNDVINITGNADTTGRPIVIAYLGHHDNVNFSFSGGEFKGVIYAPYSNIPTTNFSGTFRGNIIARNINMSSGQAATWIQHNYLKNDADIQAIVNTVEQKIRDAQNSLTQNQRKDLENEMSNAFITEILKSQNAYQRAKLYGELFPERYAELFEVLKSENSIYQSGHSASFVSYAELPESERYNWMGFNRNVYKELYDKLSASEKADDVIIAKLKEKILDKTFYNNKLTYVDKQSGYRAWKTLYEKYKDTDFKDILWPWNENFNVQPGDDQTITETVTTGETLRLINFRTEYRENGDPEAVVDPFIYMTLGNPLAY